jgi:hypothetical protein
VKGIAAAIGLSFDRDGLLEPRKKTPEAIGKALKGQQLTALEYLVGEFRAERLNTRSPEFRRGTEMQAALIARLEGREPASSPAEDDDVTGGAGSGEDPADHGGPGSTGGRAGSSGSDGGSAGNGSESRSQGGRGPNHPDTRPTLDLSGLAYSDTHVNLHRRYQELRKLEVEAVPIATAMVMRSVLESTIKWHYEATDQRAHGELKQVFTRVKDDYIGDPALRSAIGKVHSGGASQPGSITWFNGIVHDGDAAPSASEVRMAWNLSSPTPHSPHGRRGQLLLGNQDPSGSSGRATGIPLTL